MPQLNEESTRNLVAALGRMATAPARGAEMGAVIGDGLRSFRQAVPPVSSAVAQASPMSEPGGTGIDTSAFAQDGSVSLMLVVKTNHVETFRGEVPVTGSITPVPGMRSNARFHLDVTVVRHGAGRITSAATAPLPRFSLVAEGDERLPQGKC